MTTKEFSVYWWDLLDGQHEELHNVEPSKAMNAASRLTKLPSSAFVKRVIITDGMDFTNFEWTKEKGIIFPTREHLTSA